MLNYNRKGVEIKSQNRQLEMRQFYSAFLLLVAGYGLGLVVFLYENLRRRFIHNWQKASEFIFSSNMRPGNFLFEIIRENI